MKKIALLAFVALISSCGFKATYTSPRTGIVYSISEGEDGNPQIFVSGSYEKDGIKIERSVK